MTPPLQPLDDVDDLILQVERPARYVGGEVNIIVKDPSAVRVRFGLAFPDTYEVGMSNVGFRTLYHALNERPDTACERFFMPWPDLEAILREKKRPLFSLENRLPARAFDVLGFTMQFELCYTTILAMLDLSGIPLLAAERRRDDPIILGGGPCAYNPEPVADFFDAIAIGEGEEVVHEISDVVSEWKTTSESRRDLLWRLSEIPGVYVPCFFRPHYSEADRTLTALEPLKPGYERIVRRVVPDLNAVPMPERPIMPYMQTIHDRLPIEIQRGCTRGCRFCQVGMITRPTRQRSPENVLKLAQAGLDATGYDDVGFLSLSAGDYECINGLLENFLNRFSPERVGISLPSLRTETMNDSLAEQIRRVRKSGFTVAPEAATERMRRVINKGNKEENLLNAVDSIFKSGWELVKFYFMVGLPTERDEDVRAIVQLSARAFDLARKSRQNPRIHVGVSTFVPKPFTPFQWEPMIPLAETQRKHGVLREELRKLGRRYSALTVKPHEADQSAYEGALALGDRRLGTAILAAYRNGQRLDGWTEHFHLEAWERAMAEMQAKHGVDLAFFAHRGRSHDELLPWDHIECEVTRPYLWRERQRAYEEAEVVDCVLDRCTACGACDYFTVDTRVYKKEEYSVTPAPERAPDPAERTVLRLQYAKEGRLRALGHLETKTALERALRRARVPVAYSQGFSPKPRLVFSPALSVGIESQAELLDITLLGVHDGESIARAIAAELPPGLRLISWSVGPEEGLNQGANTVSYRAELSEESAAGMQAAITRFTEAVEWPVTRQLDGREKRIDLKRFVRTLTAEGSTLRMELVQGSDGGARPAEVVQSLVGAAPRRLVKESVRLGLVS
jgi:radical SAM family uncharacterized protein/radical SAM-linked protein